MSNTDDEHDTSSDEETPKEERLSNPDVVTKYKAAAEITQRAMAVVVEAIKDGAKVLDLCLLGDKTIEEAVKNVYNKKKILKGIAFPTCVSPRNIVCHLSPLPSDPEAALTVHNGDLVRIELGTHIDGYIAQLAHTVVVGASKENPITGKKADVMMAAYNAAQVAIRLCKDGKTNFDITDSVQKVAEDFECKPIEGMLSHQIKKNVIDGPKQIILNPTPESRKDVESCVFSTYEAYTLDILISTAEGKTKTMETRTTIFKRNMDITYSLKMKTSREVLTWINKNKGGLAFGLREYEEERKARMGIVECATHNLVMPYQVLYEKEDTADIAHFEFTVLILPNGPVAITFPTFDTDLVKSDKDVKDKSIIDLLKTGTKKSSSKKKKSAAKKKGDSMKVDA